MEQAAQKRRMMRYLLGQMTPEERASFEALYIENDELFNELVETEHEMLGAYVSGGISAEERRQIEEQYLTTPERRDRVAFARALLRLSEERQNGSHGTAPVPSSREPNRPALGWIAALACACVLSLLAVGWMTAENLRLRHELQAVRAELAQTAGRQQQLERELETLKTKPPEPVLPETQKRDEAIPAGVLAMTLSQLVVRGSGPGNQLEIVRGISAVQLTLNLDADDYAAYRVDLRTVEGSTVWRKAGLKSRRHGQQAAAVVVTIPVEALASGDYIVTLNGATGSHTENAGEYGLRVVRR
jgi:hypothetical protein